MDESTSATIHANSSSVGGRFSSPMTRFLIQVWPANSPTLGAMLTRAM